MGVLIVECYSDYPLILQQKKEAKDSELALKEKKFWGGKKKKKEVTLPAATVTTSPSLPNLPKINGHDLAGFFAETQFFHRTPSAMTNFGLDSIRFNINSATVITNDVVKDSDSSGESCDSDNEGAGHTCDYYGNPVSEESQSESAEEYQGPTYLSTDTYEKMKRDSGFRIWQAKKGQVVTDQVATDQVVSDPINSQPRSDSSDSSAESHSSKK